MTCDDRIFQEALKKLDKDDITADITGNVVRDVVIKNIALEAFCVGWNQGWEHKSKIGGYKGYTWKNAVKKFEEYWTEHQKEAAKEK